MESKMDLNLLLKWHKENPVNLYEKHRNAAIQDLQGNRNPFIDYPERAKEMLGL
jgi:endonuclease I